MADSFEPDSFEPDSFEPAPVGIPLDKGDTIGPTRRRLPARSDLDVGQTVRAVGGAFPGADYVGAVGEWAQDRLPQALGGAPSGQARTLEEALADARANRGEAEQAEPLAGAGGQVLAGLAMPWAKGTGVLKTALRAGQGGTLTFANELSRGVPAEQAFKDALTTAGLGAGVEGAVGLPGALRRAAPTVERWANKRGWAGAGAASAQDAQAAAEALPPGVRPDEAFGAFAKEAKLGNGKYLMERGDDAFAVGQKAKVLREEAGAAKGTLDEAVAAKGVRPDPASLVQRLEQRAEQLKDPEFMAAYGSEPYQEAQKAIEQVRMSLGEIEKKTGAPPTFAAWERIKSNLQGMVRDSSAKYGKLSNAITKPTQEMLRDFGSIVRAADEEAVQAGAPELFAQWKAAKDRFGKAAVLEPMSQAASNRAMVPAGSQPLAQHMDWATRRTLMSALAGGGAGAGAGAIGGPGGAIIGGLGGLGVGAVLGKVGEAHPSMTRNWDAIANWLGTMPDTQAKAELTARLLAALRSKEKSP